MSGHLFFCLLFLSTDCDWKTAIMSIIKDEATVTAKRPPSLWRNRDYMLLWSGQMVSSIGTEVSTLAFPLLILALTGSPATAGFAGALRALPYLVFSLPACCDKGAVASRQRAA